MKRISLLFTLILSMSMTQFAFGDSHKESKAKGKQTPKHEMLKREKNKDSRDHKSDNQVDDDDNDGKQKGKEMRADKMNDHATQAHERNAASQQAKDDYKSAVKNGDAERVKGKKPWWKLWGSDSE